MTNPQDRADKLAELPPLPDPTLEDHDYELWGQNVRDDLFTAEQMRHYARAALAEHEAARAAQHPDDAAVDAFAAAMKEKLAQARDKGRGGWQTCEPWALSEMLRDHVEKGDPRDVANFCMFLWSLGASISIPLPGSDAFDRWSRGNLTAARASQPKGEAVPVIYSPIETRPHRDGRHPNDNEPSDSARRHYLDLRGDSQGQGLDCYWKWGHSAGWNDHKRHVGEMLATPPAQPVAVPDGARAVIEKCRDALAEELGAWDIDPPLFHVKEAHDACLAWLSAALQPTQEAPQQPARHYSTTDGTRCDNCHETLSKHADGRTCPQQPAEGVQGWIPVSERLPEPDSGEVLVWLEMGRCAFDEWHMHREDPIGMSTTHTLEMGLMWRDYEFNEITHWQPLPAPPAASKSEGGEG